MSFYINNTNPNKPGPICGNPVTGLCEKVLIEATKVFDACLSQSTDTGIILTTTGYNPANPALPLTFVSAESAVNAPATISDVVVDRIDSCPNYANVSATITIPIVVTYRDANGVLGTAQSSLTVSKNVILFVPQASATPVTVKAIASFSSTMGTYTAGDTFTVTGCLQIIVKVVADVDILVPSYGYPVIPPCQSGGSNACPGFFDLPLYPTAAPNACCPKV